MIGRRVALAGLLTVAAGCATPGQVRRVETQLLVLRAETARQDSVRAAELARIIRLEQALLDSLAGTRQVVRVLDARLGVDLTDVQRQLLQIQELSGQSQRQLSVLKAQLDARADAQVTAPPAVRPDTTAAPTVTTQAPPASAEQMYTGAINQYRRGSVVVARRAFLDFLQMYPTHPSVPDAMYFVAESFDAPAPDTAMARYNDLKTRYPKSPRAPTALYKIGYLLETALKDGARARAAYQRLIAEYPRSEDAELAKNRLETLKP